MLNGCFSRSKERVADCLQLVQHFVSQRAVSGCDVLLHHNPWRSLTTSVLQKNGIDVMGGTLHQCMARRWHATRNDRATGYMVPVSKKYEKFTQLLVNNSRKSATTKEWEATIKQLLEELQVHGLAKSKQLREAVASFTHNEWLIFLKGIGKLSTIGGSSAMESNKLSRKLFFNSISKGLYEWLTRNIDDVTKIQMLQGAMECIADIKSSQLQKFLATEIEKLCEEKIGMLIAGKALLSTFYILYPNISERLFKVITRVLVRQMQDLAAEDFAMIPTWLSDYYISHTVFLQLLVNCCTKSPFKRFAGNSDLLLSFLNTVSAFNGIDYSQKSLIMRTLKQVQAELAAYTLEDVLIIADSISKLKTRKGLDMHVVHQLLHDLENRTLHLLRESEQLPSKSLASILVLFSKLSREASSYETNTSTYGKSDEGILMYLTHSIVDRFRNSGQPAIDWDELTALFEACSATSQRNIESRKLFDVVTESLRIRVAQLDLYPMALPELVSTFVKLFRACNSSFPQQLHLILPSLKQCLPSESLIKDMCVNLNREKKSSAKVKGSLLGDEQVTSTVQVQWALMLQYWWEMLRVHATQQVIRGNLEDAEKHVASIPRHVKFLEALDANGAVSTASLCSIYTSILSFPCLSSLPGVTNETFNAEDRLLLLLNREEHIQNLRRKHITTLALSTHDRRKLYGILDSLVRKEMEKNGTTSATSSAHSASGNQKSGQSYAERSGAPLLPLPALCSYYVLRLSEAEWRTTPSHSLLSLEDVEKCILLRFAALGEFFRESSAAAATARFSTDGLGKYAGSASSDFTVGEKEGKHLRVILGNGYETLGGLMRELVQIQRELFNTESRLKERQVQLTARLVESDIYQKYLNSLHNVVNGAMDAYFDVLRCMPSTRSRGLSQRFIDTCVAQSVRTIRSNTASLFIDTGYYYDNHVKPTLVRKIQSR